jgi:hypothetical protein
MTAPQHRTIPEDQMTDTQCAETPLSDHVARFWQHLETETVRIVVDLKRTVGTDAPDGPVVYWDGATFSDDVAKALVAERADMLATLREAEEALACCYQVTDYPADGHSSQDVALASVRAAIAKATGAV